MHIKASWTRHAASVVPAHSHACQCTTGSNRQPAPCASVLVPFYNCAAWLPRRALLQALEGVRMELIDAAYPLLAGGWARRSPVQLLKQPSGSHSLSLRLACSQHASTARWLQPLSSLMLLTGAQLSANGQAVQRRLF